MVRKRDSNIAYNTLIMLTKIMVLQPKANK